MAATRFDTLAYAKTLRDASVDPKIVEAQAIALSEVLKDTAGELATKTDLANLRSDLKSEMNAMKGDFKSEITEIKGDLKLLRWMAGASLAVGLAALFLLIHKALFP